MERLTNEAVKADASVDGMIGPFVDLTNMKPKLLDVILNGPTIISVSKNVLRSIIRQLYRVLAAYEDTGLTPEQCAEYAKADREGRYIVLRDAEQEGVKRLRELAKADKDGRVMVLPCKLGDTVWYVTTTGILGFAITNFVKNCDGDYAVSDYTTFPIRLFGKTVFLTREEAEEKMKEVQKLVNLPHQNEQLKHGTGG